MSAGGMRRGTYHEHAHSHPSPNHHTSPGCDAACRAGKRVHAHGFKEVGYRSGEGEFKRKSGTLRDETIEGPFYNGGTKVSGPWEVERESNGPVLTLYHYAHPLATLDMNTRRITAVPREGHGFSKSDIDGVRQLERVTHATLIDPEALRVTHAVRSVRNAYGYTIEGNFSPYADPYGSSAYRYAPRRKLKPSGG